VSGVRLDVFQSTQFIVYLYCFLSCFEYLLNFFILIILIIIILRVFLLFGTLVLLVG